MERKRKIMKVVVAVLGVILVGLTAGGFWYRDNHVAVREQEVPENLTSLTITSLTAEDVEDLDEMTALKEVDARGCRDYDQLLELQKRHENCQVQYTVLLSGQEYPQDAGAVTLTSLTEEELDLIQYLPDVQTVYAWDCPEHALLQQLQQRYPHLQVHYTLTIGGVEYAPDTAVLEVPGITEEELSLVASLPGLESIHMPEPKASAEALLQLVESRPEVEATWEMELLGLKLDNTTVEVDLSGIALTDTGAVSETLAYFPNVETVILSGCGIDNETMAAFREEKREEYKVVWTVDCGRLTVRTDETFFAPAKHGIYSFKNDDAYNLRYCEDMVCIDVVDSAVRDISFVEFMPHLKYLVLAYSEVTDITALSGCRELVYLEMQWTGIRDYEPLLGCTALEDLNLGYTYGDENVIAQLTWLKNLWWSGRGNKVWMTLEEALTDTHLEFRVEKPTGRGWRKLPNYYDMRDILGMPYLQ